MEDNIMTNEEVIELTEEIVDAKLGKGWKRFRIGVVTVVVGGVAYRYAVKPLVKKIKAKRAEKKGFKEDCEYSAGVMDDAIEIDYQE